MTVSAKFVLQQVLLVCFNASMIIGVVFVGKAMPDHFFFFALAVCVISMLIYFPRALYTRGYKAHAYNARLAWAQGWRRTGVIGIGWGINFWFVVWANPNTPAMIQVILNEMGVGIAMLGSYLLLGKRYDYVHYFSIYFITMGGLVLIATSQIDAGGARAIVWDLLYFVNTAAIPIAVVITEYFVTLRSDSAPGAPHGVDLPWMLGWSSAWTMLWCFVMAVITYPISGGSLTQLFDDTAIGARCFFLQEGKANDNCAVGTAAIVIASLSSCFSTWVQASVTRSDGAVYSNMDTALAPGLAAVYFSVPALMGQYYDESLAMNRVTVISLLIVFGGVALYKLHSFRATGAGAAQQTPRIARIDAGLAEGEKLYSPLLLAAAAATEGRLSTQDDFFQPIGTYERME